MSEHIAFRSAANAQAITQILLLDLLTDSDDPRRGNILDPLWDEVADAARLLSFIEDFACTQKSEHFPGDCLWENTKLDWEEASIKIASQILTGGTVSLSFLYDLLGVPEEIRPAITKYADQQLELAANGARAIVEVSGGVVTAVHCNIPIDVDVLDRDDQDGTHEDEVDEHSRFNRLDAETKDLPYQVY